MNTIVSVAIQMHCITLHQLPQIPAGLTHHCAGSSPQTAKFGVWVLRVSRRECVCSVAECKLYRSCSLESVVKNSPNLTNGTTDVGRARDRRPAGSSRQLKGSRGPSRDTQVPPQARAKVTTFTRLARESLCFDAKVAEGSRYDGHIRKANTSTSARLPEHFREHSITNH